MEDFIVARNPSSFSRLPYLVYLPLRAGPIWLKAAGDWPRANSLYCFELGNAPPLEDLEVIRRSAVLVCERIGTAVDLVLERGNNKRSQFVFTRDRDGRPMILWQTSASVRAVRPGLRVPTVHSKTVSAIVIDTRERYGYTFKAQSARTERIALPVGDYAAMVNGDYVGVVERKTFDDFVRSLVDGSLVFCMAELATVPAAAVAVEGRYTQLLRHKTVKPRLLVDLLTRVQVRYRSVAINFLETKKVAEMWTYAFLTLAHDMARCGRN